MLLLLKFPFLFLLESHSFGVCLCKRTWALAAENHRIPTKLTVLKNRLCDMFTHAYQLLYKQLWFVDIELQLATANGSNSQSNANEIGNKINLNVAQKLLICSSWTKFLEKCNQFYGGNTLISTWNWLRLWLWYRVGYANCYALYVGCSDYSAKCICCWHNEEKKKLENEKRDDDNDKNWEMKQSRCENSRMAKYSGYVQWAKGEN